MSSGVKKGYLRTAPVSGLMMSMSERSLFLKNSESELTGLRGSFWSEGKS